MVGSAAAPDNRHCANIYNAAFILYRQHHQSQVTADNPKLSNPEISKIIGEKWKHEAEDVKETWKKLAEEEKQRHQHQYPNYRYQPRRGSKVQGSWPNTPSGDDSGRCMKCNGRTTATPRTPSTPVATPPSVKIGPHGQPALPRIDTSGPRRLSMELSPASKLPMPHQQLPPVRYEDDPTSPDAKRRRANGAGNYHAVSRLHGTFSDGPPDSMRTSPEGGPYPAMRPYPHTSLPELSTIPRSHSGPMPPPPRPPGGGQWPEQEPVRRHSGFDESLRLPPLQTAVSPSPVRTQSLDMRQPMLPSPVFTLHAPQEKRPRTTEDAVMSIPFKRKLGALSRVSRTLPVHSSEHDRSPIEPRGAIIAVEGPNPPMLQNVGQAVEKALLACGEVSLRTWTTGSETTEPAGSAGSNSALAETGFPAYFRTIMSWQEKARQITAFVTGKSEASSTAESRHSRRRDTGAPHGLDTTRVPEHAPLASSQVPVALMKEGYSLTLADKFANSMPNADLYSPQDHWQWMANMWRGTPNADLVVYVQPSDEEEIKKFGTVEIAKRMGLIVVRLPSGMMIDEATEGRVALGIVEWIRDGAFRHAVPPNWRDD